MNSRLLLATLSIFTTLLCCTAQESQKYVGKQACWSCHTKQQESVAGTPHDGGKSCEGCHGPGEQHVRSGDKRNTIFSYKQAPAYLVREQCRQCHNSPVMSRHAEGDVSCLACHSAHHYLKKKYLLRPQQDLLDHPAKLRRAHLRTVA